MKLAPVFCLLPIAAIAVEATALPAKRADAVPVDQGNDSDPRKINTGILPVLPDNMPPLEASGEARQDSTHDKAESKMTTSEPAPEQSPRPLSELNEDDLRAIVQQMLRAALSTTSDPSISKRHVNDNDNNDDHHHHSSTSPAVGANDYTIAYDMTNLHGSSKRGNVTLLDDRATTYVLPDFYPGGWNYALHRDWEAEYDTKTKRALFERVDLHYLQWMTHHFMENKGGCFNPSLVCGTPEYNQRMDKVGDSLGQGFWIRGWGFKGFTKWTTDLKNAFCNPLLCKAHSLLGNTDI